MCKHKMIIYYCAVIVGSVVALFTLFDYVNVTFLSVIPIALCVLSSSQASMFKNEEGNTYGSNYSKEEQNEMLQYMSMSLKISVPWHIPFVYFFSDGFKFISVAVYLLGMFGGTLVYVLKNRKEIKSRIDKEQDEAKKQSELEELGRMK